MTGPALYRYFTNRDSLLTELVIDAYGDLASALARAADSRRDGRGRPPDRGRPGLSRLGADRATPLPAPVPGAPPGL